MVRRGVVGAWILLLAGCGVGELGDKGASGDRGSVQPLMSGTYALSGAELVTDTCLFGWSFYEGLTEAVVTVTVESLEIELSPGETYVYEITGTELLDTQFSGTGVFDFSAADTASEFGLSQPYDCQLVFDARYSGEITSLTSFRLTDAYSIEATGAACDALATELGAPLTELLAVETLPCTTIDRVDASL